MERGLLVTSAPHIYYLEDTDGDNRADTREVLFSGFFAENSEAQITNLRYHINNWIYAANFGQKGEITYDRQPEKPVIDVKGSDFRFRLDRNQFEPVEARTQFGHAMDDWGNRFVAMNTLHVRHPVIPRQYLQRSDKTPKPTALLNISDHEHEMFQLTPPPYWRAERTRRRQKRYDEQGLDRIEYAEDHFTGSCGSTIYAGDGFPDTFYGNLFTGDVAGNLIHRDILVPHDKSPTFVAHRDSSEMDREFLATTDSWFRPAKFYGRS